jgi:transcription elongation factor GreA
MAPSSNKYYVSAERLAELKAELDTLKTKTRLEIAELLKRSKEYGDLSENAEYAEAREEQARVEQRIFELEELLKRAAVIAKTTSGDTVQIGSKVTVEKGGKEFVYTIVGSSESKPEEGKISNESPIGKALLGKKAGDKAEVLMPAGKATYEITKIG